MARSRWMMGLLGAALLASGWGADSAVAFGSTSFQARILSNERTTTRWAHIAYRGHIFALPEKRARRVGRLRWDTEDGFPEVYLLLRSHRDAAGQEWVELRVPTRPNGLIGWVRRQALGSFEVTHKRLVVDRRRLRMTLYKNGRRRWSAPVGIGKPLTPTPPGRFWIRERFKISDPRSPYAPFALGTAAYSRLSEWPGGGVVGIHGDFNQPHLVPGRPSHGCIRMHRGNLTWLARHAGPGTPLLIKR